MPKPKQRQSDITIISPSLLNEAGASLEKLPAKTKEVWSLREVVVLLQDDITTALQRGYSYEEIVAVLKKKRISITASSLKRYLAMARRESGKSKPRKPRQPKVVDLAAKPAKVGRPAAKSIGHSSPPAPQAEKTKSAQSTAATKRRGRTPSKK